MDQLLGESGFRLLGAGEEFVARMAAVGNPGLVDWEVRPDRSQRKNWRGKVTGYEVVSRPTVKAWCVGRAEGHDILLTPHCEWTRRGVVSFYAKAEVPWCSRIATDDAAWESFALLNGDELLEGLGVLLAEHDA